MPSPLPPPHCFWRLAGQGHLGAESRHWGLRELQWYWSRTLASLSSQTTLDWTCEVGDYYWLGCLRPASLWPAAGHILTERTLPRRESTRASVPFITFFTLHFTAPSAVPSGAEGHCLVPVEGVHWRDWCWGWNSSTLATSCEELTHWKRLWCWEGLGAGGEGDDRGRDGWMASPTRWTWVWVNSGNWWYTWRPGVLQFMGLQRVGHDWATELNWTDFPYRHVIVNWKVQKKETIHNHKNVPRVPF